MEKESSTAAYDDVFGGPPRFSAPFASRLGDYSEIFGGLASSCSIPVLDLPPALDLFDAPRSSVLDYFEIFGGFDGGDIAPTYEELVAEQERVEVRPSSNGRSPNEAELGQQTTDISEFSPACSNRSHVACLAKDQIASNDHHLNDSHKTNQGNAEDATNEAAQNAQPHVVSGFTSDIERSDDPPNEATIDHSHNAGLNGTPNEATIDHSHSAALNGRLNDEKQGQTYSRSSSEASSKSSGNCLKSDQKQFARCPTSVDGPAYLKHHSRSSSSHSTSSGDTYYPDFTYLTVSDISLRTQPLQVPPPTRPPPKFANNQDITKMEIRANSETDLDEASLSKHVPNHQKHSGSDAPKRRAPRVPVKESSFFFDVEVDASSAASAMKEAMEQAQARLKSAKESMERNRDNLKSRKKLGHKEGSKCEEGKEAASQKIIMKENKKKNEFSVEDKQKARGAAKVAPDHEENDRRVVSDELNGFRSSLPSYELNDRTGEWKTDKQFYELVHNENFADKIPKETIEVNKERENESKVADLSYEFERKGYAWEVNGTCEKEEHAKILKFGDTTTLPEEKNVNKFEEVYDSYQPVEDQSKLGQTLEAHISEEEVKKPNIGEDSPACFISACSFEVASKNKERESKLGDTKEVSECDGVVELNKNYPTCQPHSSENRLEIANKTGIEVDNNESKTPYASGTWEAPEEVEAAPDLSHCENSEKIRENSTAKWYQEEIPEEHKASEGGTRSRENNITEAVKEDDYEENKAREAQIGCQQDEIEQTAAQVPCELENSVMLTVALPVHKKSENQSIREVHLNMDVKEKYNILNVAQEVFQRVVSKDAAEREKERRIGGERELEEREKERRVQRERELEEREKERRIEREKELEKERKLEEEREREKEREKDRVAVERATREARERAIAEARERAERIAVERITAEARQRALTEAREKAEKASAEALEKSLADKASREARLRAERVAVERVTAEARDRAAEKAAADARERVEKLNAASSRAKMRRDNEAEEHSRAGEKGDSGTRVKPSFSGTQDNSKSEVGEGDSPLRCKARLERHQRTVERAAKALAEKNMRDILAQKEQAERNRLAETLDADVRRWSTGKEGNLRALLSTLQYILGAESGWQPIPLTDVITAVAVKKAYRKATLCVHPDKLQQRGASIQQKYICEKVFDLLKDAWNRFNSEER